MERAPETPALSLATLPETEHHQIIGLFNATHADCPKDKLNTLRKLGSPYQGHPDVRFLPALEASTGSLGEGVSLGIGMGFAARLDGRPSRTYVVIGDGESQEGQVWEAAMAAAFHKVDNIVGVAFGIDSTYIPRPSPVSVLKV